MKTYWICGLLILCSLCACRSKARQGSSTSAEALNESGHAAIMEKEGELPDLSSKIKLETRVGYTGDVSISVANMSTQKICVPSDITLERWEHNGEHKGWQPTKVPLKLRYSCRQSVPTCFELMPGAELFPPGISNTQCGCTPCEGLKQDRYRISIRGSYSEFEVGP